MLDLCEALSLRLETKRARARAHTRNSRGDEDAKEKKEQSCKVERTVSLSAGRSECAFEKIKKMFARARARVNEESDVTRLIYDAVTRALYNTLIILSAR